MIEVFRKAEAHEAREGDDDVDVAGEVGVEEERIDEGEAEGGVQFELQRLRLSHLRKGVFLYCMEQHCQHINLEEAANDPLQLQADRARSEGDRIGRKLVPGELVIALDRPRN